MDKELNDDEKSYLKYLLQDMNIYECVDQLNMEQCCEVGESKIQNAGLGLIATKNIKRGDLITIYPPHWVSIIRGDIYLKPIKIYKGDMNETPTHINKCMKYYSLNDRFKMFSIIGNPDIIDDFRFLGHMINDAINTEFKNNSTIILDNSKSLEATSIIANMDIKCGEEILTSYGKNYWIYL